MSDQYAIGEEQWAIRHQQHAVKQAGQQFIDQVLVPAHVKARKPKLALRTAVAMRNLCITLMSKASCQFVESTPCDYGHFQQWQRWLTPDGVPILLDPNGQWQAEEPTYF